MKHKITLSVSVIAVCALLSLAGCQKEMEEPAPYGGAMNPLKELPAAVDAPEGLNCFNFSHAASGPLGFPVTIPLTPPVTGAGLLPLQVQVGGYSGWLSSVVTSVSQNGQGALTYQLMHYFDDGGGNTFWTQDFAVCAPVGNDPMQCRINDLLLVVGGTGDFACVSGLIRNKGIIQFASVGGQVLPVSLDMLMRGRLCLDCN